MTAAPLAPLDPSGPDGHAILVCADGSLAGSRYEVSGPITRIGRDPASDVFLDDVTVSRHHAEIERIGPAYVLRDCSSFNGTYLGGERVEEILLDHGDELRIGRFVLAFLTLR